MAIAMSLQEFLKDNDIGFDVVPHSYTTSSMSTAEAARISGEAIAKSVILEDEKGYVMAVIPATHHVEIGVLSEQMNRHLGLATEPELGRIFNDCVPGAIPPLGTSYGMDVAYDDCLNDCTEVYFEAGDHTEMIHIKGEDFRKMMTKAHHGHFTRHI